MLCPAKVWPLIKRFSFGHHVRGGYDRYKPSRSHSGKTFGNVYHQPLKCGGMGKSIPGGRLWIPPPRLAYNQTSLMAASVIEVKLFVGHAGMQAGAQIYPCTQEESILTQSFNVQTKTAKDLGCCVKFKYKQNAIFVISFDLYSIEHSTYIRYLTF